MKELWVKKTIYRRYLIEDDEIEEAENILKNEPKRAEDLIEDIYDKNPHVEYDEEQLYIEIDYSIGAVAEDSNEAKAALPLHGVSNLACKNASTCTIRPINHVCNKNKKCFE